MSEGVHRVDAPTVARRMVFGKANTIDRRITQIHVGASHIDLGTQDHGAFSMFPIAHFMEKAKVVFNGAFTVRRIATWFTQRAAVFAHFICALLIDVGVARLDQMFRKSVHVVKVGACEVEVRFPFILPVKAQPTHAVFNPVNVLLIFLFRVRIVKTHMASAAIHAG